jgi:hypothetical protein
MHHAVWATHDTLIAAEKLENICFSRQVVLILSGAIPVVYVLIRIREIRRTQLSWNLLYLLYSLSRQHVSTLSRGHRQALEMITKSMDVRLPDGIPFGTVSIRKYGKMEHTETNILIILNRNELVFNAECRGWSTCTDGIKFVV